MIDAVDAARAGVTMIEHLYGYAEAALPGTQDYPRDYDYDNENHRFREAGRVWVEAGKDQRTRTTVGRGRRFARRSGVTMLPTRVAYEANRDIVRAEGLPWHEGPRTSR